MAAYIKFLAGNLENREYNYIGGKNKFHNYKPMRGPSLHLTDFASLEIANEENVKKLGGTLGGAMVGGLLLGGVGAIAGAVVGGSGKESTVIVTLRDGKKSLAKVNGPMLEAMQAHLFKLEENPNYAPFPQKEKMALWKKLVIAVIVIVVLGAIAGRGKKGEQPTSAPATTQESNR